MGNFTSINKEKVAKFQKACPHGHTTISKTADTGRKSVSNVPDGMVSLYIRQGWTVEQPAPAQDIPEGVEKATEKKKTLRTKKASA